MHSSFLSEIIWRNFALKVAEHDFHIYLSKEGIIKDNVIEYCWIAALR